MLYYSSDYNKPDLFVLSNVIFNDCFFFICAEWLSKCVWITYVMGTSAAEDFVRKVHVFITVIFGIWFAILVFRQFHCLLSSSVNAHR